MGYSMFYLHWEDALVLCRDASSLVKKTEAYIQGSKLDKFPLVGQLTTNFASTSLNITCRS